MGKSSSGYLILRNVYNTSKLMSQSPSPKSSAAAESVLTLKQATILVRIQPETERI